MKIGCLCVTENRAAIIGIALASYETQHWPNRTMLVADASSAVDLAVVEHCRRVGVIYTYVEPPRSVPERLEDACRVLFHRLKCDLVAMWDDDDWAPPDRLSLAVEAYITANVRLPWVWSYTRGHFVSLRTLNGHEIVCTPEGALWGGCLTFNEAAWANCPFSKLPAVGYDREFVAEQRRRSLHAVAGPQAQIVTAPPDAQLPVAFVHGHNVATQLCSPVEDYERRLFVGGLLPDPVGWAVRNAQAFLEEHRVYPSEPPPAAKEPT